MLSRTIWRCVSPRLGLGGRGLQMSFVRDSKTLLSLAIYDSLCAGWLYILLETICLLSVIYDIVVTMIELELL